MAFTLFYTIASMTMAIVASQECPSTSSFTISSPVYPAADGCYEYAGTNESGGKVFPSTTDPNDAVFEFDSIIDDTETDHIYYLTFSSPTGNTDEFGFCASVSTAIDIGHPAHIDENGGWALCFDEGEDGEFNGNVSPGDISITCGCSSTPATSPSPTPEPVSPTPEPVSPTPTPEPVSPTPTPEPVSPTPTPEPVSPTPTPEPVSPPTIGSPTESLPTNTSGSSVASVAGSTFFIAFLGSLISMFF